MSTTSICTWPTTSTPTSRAATRFGGVRRAVARRARSAPTASATSTRGAARRRRWPRARRGGPERATRCSTAATSAEVLPLCAERDVAYLAFSPLAGGWLTGKYRPRRAVPGGLADDPAARALPRLVSDAIFDALERLGRFAARARDLDGRRCAGLAAGRRAGHPDRRRAGPPGPSDAGSRGARSIRCSPDERVGRAGDLLADGVLVLSHDDVLAALAPADCAEAMAAVLAAHARGEAYMPLRSVMSAARARPGSWG